MGLCLLTRDRRGYGGAGGIVDAFSSGQRDAFAGWIWTRLDKFNLETLVIVAQQHEGKERIVSTAFWYMVSKADSSKPHDDFGLAGWYEHTGPFSFIFTYDADLEGHLEPDREGILY